MLSLSTQAGSLVSSNSGVWFCSPSRAVSLQAACCFVLLPHRSRRAHEWNITDTKENSWHPPQQKKLTYHSLKTSALIQGMHTHTTVPSQGYHWRRGTEKGEEKGWRRGEGWEGKEEEVREMFPCYIQMLHCLPKQPSLWVALRVPV